MGEVALMSPTLPSGITDSISTSHWRKSDEESALLSEVDLPPFLDTVEQILVGTGLAEIQRNWAGFHRRSLFYVHLQRLLASELSWAQLDLPHIYTGR